MAIPTIVQTVKTYFGSEIAEQCATALGEKRSAIKKAYNTIVPLALGSIASQANASKSGSEKMFEYATKYAVSIASFFDLKVLESEAAHLPVTELFGKNGDEISTRVSEYTGIKKSSAQSLLRWALPVAFGLLGNHCKRKKLSASGLSGYLSAQTNSIIKAIPVALQPLTALLSYSNLAINRNAASAEEMTRSTRANPTGGISSALLLLFAFTAGIWFYAKSCSVPKQHTNNLPELHARATDVSS